MSGFQMIPNADSERDAIANFLETLQSLPDVTARKLHEGSPSLANQRPGDADLALDVAGTSVTMLVTFKKAVFPREARELLWKIKEQGPFKGSGARRGQTVHVLLADSIGPGAKKLLRDEGIGYFDAGGSLFIPAKGAYLLLEKPAPKAQAREARSIFKGRRAQVILVLLHQPRAWLNGKVLAKRAMVSQATASQTLAALERFEWVVARGQGPAKERSLAEPGALLDAWVAQLAAAPPPAPRRYFVPGISQGGLIEAVAKVFEANHAEHAFTAEAAAQHYAPWLSSLSQVRCRLLAGAAATAAINALEARPVDEGANLLVAEVKSPGDLLLREHVGPAWFASPVQVYLDLLRGEGRAKDAAAHLRKERIGF
jgi:hypothetical protein